MNLSDSRVLNDTSTTYIGEIKQLSPSELSEDEAAALTDKNIEQTKRIFCNNYRTCLTIAEKSNWAGFGCNECKGYKEMPREQREMDVLGLLVARRAAKFVHLQGNANRRRGVKPGAEMHRIRHTVIADRMESDLDITELRRLVL